MTAGDARRRVRRGLTAAVLVLVAGSQLGWSCTETCEQPYRPIASRWQPSGGEGAGVWVGEWPVTGDRRDFRVPELDTDGDGITDTRTASADETTLTIGRSSGDLVLTAPAPLATAEITSADVDGDGRSDVVVRVAGETTWRIVPGTTPDGTYAFADFAAPFAALPDGTYLRPDVVGDVDGDGRDDFVGQTYVAGAPHNLVWLAADLDLTPGSPPAAPAHDLEGQLAGVVLLDGRNALGLLTRDASPEQQSLDATLWLPEVTFRFTTEGSDLPRFGPSGGYTHLVQDGDQAWLILDQGGRGGDQEWAFDLTDLCAGSPALPALRPG
jgi:hypothetical protein